MIVCICHRVSDRDIAREAESGCADFEALQDELRVGTACGACLEHAQAAFAEHGCAGCPGARHCGGAPLSLAA